MFLSVRHLHMKQTRRKEGVFRSMVSGTGRAGKLPELPVAITGIFVWRLISSTNAFANWGFAWTLVVRGHACEEGRIHLSQRFAGLPQAHALHTSLSGCPKVSRLYAGNVYSGPIQFECAALKPRVNGPLPLSHVKVSTVMSSSWPNLWAASVVWFASAPVASSACNRSKLKSSPS